MTVNGLIDEIEKELKEVFKDFRLKNNEGEEKKLKIFNQDLPIKSKRNDKSNFPYIIIRVEGGKIQNKDSLYNCEICFIVGVYDGDENRQGFRDVLNIINKVYYHFFTKKIIGKKYEIEYPIEWTPQDEDTYPYFFGGIRTNWTLAQVEKDDKYC